MNNFLDPRGGAAGGPVEWLLSLPPVTRIWFGSTLAITALVNLNVLHWNDVDLAQWTDVMGKVGSVKNNNIFFGALFGRLELWRILTCFLFVGKFGWGTIINLHLMTQISTRYETMGPVCTRRIYIPHDAQHQQNSTHHNNHNNNNNNSPYYSRGETSDYIFTLLFGITGILLSQFYLIPYITSTSYRFFHRHLTFYILYIWSKQHPHHNVNLFGMVMPAAYLPFAYLVLGFAMSNGEVIPTDMLHGMFIGHVYYYLACVVPTVLGRGRVFIWTPRILIDLCHWLEGRRLGFANDGLGDGEPIVVDTDGVIGG